MNVRVSITSTGEDGVGSRRVVMIWLSEMRPDLMKVPPTSIPAIRLIDTLGAIEGY